MSDYIPLTLLQKSFPMEACYGLVSFMEFFERYNVDFVNRENLQALRNGGIQICNHQSMFDIPIEMLGIRRELGFNSYPYHIIRPMSIVKYVGGIAITRPKDVRNGKKKIKASNIFNEIVPEIVSKNGIITIFPQGTRKPIDSEFQVEKEQLRYLHSCDLHERPIIQTHIKYFSEPSFKSIDPVLTIGEPISRIGSLEDFTSRVNSWFQEIDNSYQLN